MKKFLLPFIILLLLFINSCKKEDNPVEPEKKPIENPIMYDGKFYSPDSLKTWGMGSSQIEYKHNDKEYEWYIDQANTGSAAGNNCGPSCVTMAIKWFDKNFSKSAADARNMYPQDGGWWYTNNIIDYLNYYKTTNVVVNYSDESQLEDVISGGNIAILCISTEFLRYNTNNKQRVDRFYSYANGHFVVVKGFRKVEGETYFEVYDPNTWGEKYSDGSLKGKNRHYRAADISNAIKKWWNYLIVVSKNGLNKKFYLQSENPENIKHMWGK